MKTDKIFVRTATGGKYMTHEQYETSFKRHHAKQLRELGIPDHLIKTTDYLFGREGLRNLLFQLYKQNPQPKPTAEMTRTAYSILLDIPTKTEEK